jgi:hypothetical protein
VRAFFVSIAELNTLYEAAVAAIDNGSYDVAIAKIMAMKARLATTPNLSRNLGGGGSQSIAWNPSQLDSLIADCRKMKVAAAHAVSGPFVQIPVTYRRCETTGDYK